MRGLNRNLAWSGALLEELALCGVRSAVVSPGSRSAPLAIAAASEPRIEDHAVLDERAAGFLALGLARASRAPVALICTSGSAAANYLPALVEAHHARVPLIVLSADRPPELRDCAAGQVIEQRGLYRAFVRWEHELPVPEVDAALFRHLRSVAARATAVAGGEPPGPVHLNVPLREPLDAALVEADATALDALGLAAPATAASTTTTAPAPALPGETALAELASELAAVRRGLLVVGPCDAAGIAAATAALADALGWPLLGEPLSQLRCDPACAPQLVDAHDALLRSARFVDAHAPDCVLRLGDPPTSKALRLALEARPGVRQIVVDAAGWSDPSALAARMVRAEPVVLARALTAELRAGTRAVPAFREAWIGAGRRARAVLDAGLDRAVADAEPPGDALLVRALAEAAPPGTLVHLASSSPVRLADLYWPAGARAQRFVANRGASGIDGTVSSALGAALAGAPAILLTGDLALLHDASGWIAAARSDADLTVVAIDNDGGGIFEWLPAATSLPRALFERHLAAGQGLDLVAALCGFGLRARRVDGPKELIDALAASCGRPGTDVLVAPSDRRREAARLGAQMQAVDDALANRG